MQIYNFWNYTIEVTEKNDFDFSMYNYPHLINSIHRCTQIHSNIIHEYHQNQDTPEWDGIYSNQSWIKLAVGVSDCNAVVIMGSERYGILHAGRRGLRDGIIQTMIHKLKEKEKSDLKIFVWPSIRTCCYEVGEEFTSYFDSKYLIKQENGKYTLDMIANISDIFKELSISDITIHQVCTKCSNNFFSYRNWDRINNILTIQKN